MCGNGLINNNIVINSHGETYNPYALFHVEFPDQLTSVTNS